ncbi:MAG: Bug family tripartite tricarboxylate transporter substrate binding protein [Burkholderiales bacterium]
MKAIAYLAGISLAIASAASLAQSYPAKPIRLITPFTAGAGADNVTRRAAEDLFQRLGQPIVHEARPGGNFVISGEACAKAPPDGYTLCVMTPGTVSYAPFVMKQLPYDAERDFKPVVNLFWVIGGFFANPALGVNNMDELRNLVGKGRNFNWATFGVGNNTDAVRQWVQDGLKMRATAIPYNGPPAIITAVMTGEADFTWIGVFNAIGQMKANKIKLIAVDSTKRWPIMPAVPTLDETVGQFNMRVWIGIMGPSALPEAIARRLNGEYVKLFNEARFGQFLEEQGVQNGVGSIEDFTNTLRADRRDAEIFVKRYNFAIQ